jgi:tRNA A-37 threonylcarbamoyl transferase component Bud32
VDGEVRFTGQSGSSWRYWTHQRLGRKGGFGQVYAGEGQDRRQVAVKVVPKLQGGERLDSRLLRREIAVGDKVAYSRSDYLLPLLDAAENEDAIFLVMPMAEGSLHDVPRPLAEPGLIAILLDIAAGLQVLHRMGIIHRDLKPDNVLRYRERWVLADFGIAHDEEIGTGWSAKYLVGTHAYMAPELWKSEPPSGPTDLYALGCMAYELLTGTPPYPGSTAEIRDGHLYAPPPQVPVANPVLGNLIARLIAKDPGERPQDARAVIDRLLRARKPRDETQEEIARSIANYASDISMAAASEAARRRAREGLRQLAAQAKAELREIFSDVRDELGVIEPNVTLRLATDAEQDATAGRANQHQTDICVLRTPVASLSCRLQWSPPKEPDQPSSYLEDLDPAITALMSKRIVVGGYAIITNPLVEREMAVTRYVSGNEGRPDIGGTGINAANILYLSSGDRMSWQIYRFARQAGRPSDSYSNSIYFREVGPYWHSHGLNYTCITRYLMGDEYIRFYGSSFQMTEPLTVTSMLGLFRESIDLRLPADGRWR